MEKTNFAASPAKSGETVGLFSTAIRCVAFGLAILAMRHSLADGEISWSGPGCVLLKNGNVLSASNITTQGQNIAVRLDQTGEVRIPNKDVAAIGRDKLELYNYQVSASKEWGAGEHWHLAKWCLRQGLVEQSKTHYDKLKLLSGDHAKFKQLDAELKHALLQDPVMKAALKTFFPGETTYAASDKKSNSNSTGELVIAASDQSNSALPNEKGSIARDFATDRYAQDYFRQQLQPFLSMRCGQAGCHGAFGKSEFHIAKSGSMFGRRSVDIGYTSAARFLDSENVEATTLWIKATTAHGLQVVPSLDAKIPAERELLNRLQRWHQAISRNNSPVSMPNTNQATPHAPTSASPPSSTKTMHSISKPFNSNIMTGFTDTSNSKEPASLPPEIQGELLTLEREIAKLEEKERARKIPNRHDPEEFNRRFSSSPPLP